MQVLQVLLRGNLEDGQVLEGLGEFEGFARIGRSESIGRIGKIIRVLQK